MPSTRIWFPRSVAVAVMFTLLACGGGDKQVITGPGLGNGGEVAAALNGASFLSITTTAVYDAVNSAMGFSATGLIGSETWVITIGASPISGPGTYTFDLGGTPSVYGGVANSKTGWSTPQAAASGTLKITTLSGSRMVGTFSFTADYSSGDATGAPGPVSVTNGSFDIALP